MRAPTAAVVAMIALAVPASADPTDQAYHQRIVELLAVQDQAVLKDGGVVITHEGESVTLHGSDLDWIAYNSCLGSDAAKTVGWIKDAFDLQRRWEAAQIRLAAIQTKCP